MSPEVLFRCLFAVGQRWGKIAVVLSLSCYVASPGRPSIPMDAEELQWLG
jgi:hypothetical protein